MAKLAKLAKLKKLSKIPSREKLAKEKRIASAY